MIGLILLAACLVAVTAKPLDDYVNKPDSNYGTCDKGPEEIPFPATTAEAKT
jgi:hypothetical protein